MSGALLIDKPSGPTSHDVVAFVRRTLNEPRVGHTGTLDPLATGLLILLVGATRLAQFLAADEKEYIADVRLGEATATYDAQSLSDVRGASSEVRRPTNVELEAVLGRFRGSFLQTPPPYSAKKTASVPAYEKARRNQPVELKPVRVTVRELQVLDTAERGPRTSDLGARDATLIRLRVAASAGFYVRSLAHEIGQALGCGAHLEALRRTRAGRFSVDDALTLDQVEAHGMEALIAPAALLVHLPAVTLTDEGVRRATHGNALDRAVIRDGVGSDPVDGAVIRDGVGSDPGSGRPDDLGAALPENRRRIRLLDGAGDLVAVAETRAGGLLQPLVVLR